jgi:hypothetical protein
VFHVDSPCVVSRRWFAVLSSLGESPESVPDASLSEPLLLVLRLSLFGIASTIPHVRCLTLKALCVQLLLSRPSVISSTAS